VISILIGVMIMFFIIPSSSAWFLSTIINGVDYAMEGRTKYGAQRFLKSLLFGWAYWSIFLYNAVASAFKKEEPEND